MLCSVKVPVSPNYASIATLLCNIILFIAVNIFNFLPLCFLVSFIILEFVRTVDLI